MKKMIIEIASQQAVRARALAIASGDHQPRPDEPKIWFTSMRSLAEVLSDDNRALLRVIREEKPGKRCQEKVSRKRCQRQFSVEFPDALRRVRGAGDPGDVVENGVVENGVRFTS